MFHLHVGSHLHKLLSLLSVVGEMPFSSLHLLGNKQSVINYLYFTKKKCSIKNGEREMTCKLFKIFGEKETKRVRINISATSILEWFGGKEYYDKFLLGGYLPSSRDHLDRRFRVAETAALCMGAGIEFRPYRLPNLQDKKFVSVVQNEPAFYPVKIIKNLGGDDTEKKIRETRMTGTIMTPTGGYVVYNVRGSVMKWKSSNENRAKERIEDIIRLNYGIRSSCKSIFLGNSYMIANNLLEDIKNCKGKDLRFDSVYYNVHFVTLDEFGMKLLQLIVLPSFHQRMLLELFNESDLVSQSSIFDYDAHKGNKYIMSFLGSDLTKLIRFCEGLRCYKVEGEVLCYPEQVSFVKKYVGESVGIKTIPIDTVIKLFNVERRDLFEKL